LERVLVTGVSGRIGSRVAPALIEKGYSVRGYIMPNDPMAPSLERLGIELVKGDLREYEKLVKAMDGVTRVVHLGYVMGMGTWGVKSRKEYFDVNVEGTFNVLEAASKQAGTLERFVFASTDATYPVAPPPDAPRYSPVDENHPQKPTSLYGVTKLMGEKMCLEYQEEFGIPVSIVRFGIVIAKEEVGKGTWGDILGQLTINRKGKTPVAYFLNDGRPWKFHTVDVRDVVQGVILALEKDAAVGEAFHILGPAACTSIEAVKYLSKAMNVSYVTQKREPGYHYEIDISKAKCQLGYRPRYNIYDIIDAALKEREKQEKS